MLLVDNSLEMGANSYPTGEIVPTEEVKEVCYSLLLLGVYWLRYSDWKNLSLIS